MGLQHLVLRKQEYGALFNYLQGVNWKQIFINLNVKATQLLQKKRRRKLNFALFSSSNGSQNFPYRFVVLLCLTHWSDALTSLIRLVFYFISKAPWKPFFFLVIPNLTREIEFTQSSFILAHQISHRTIEITNARSLIYTKKLKTFSSTCEVPKFVEKYQFSHLSAKLRGS